MKRTSHANSLKRSVVEAALRDPADRGLTNQEIADQCGVCPRTVSRIRVELYGSWKRPRPAPPDVPEHPADDIFLTDAQIRDRLSTFYEWKARQRQRRGITP